MRILITTGHRNLVGGIETYLQAVLPGLLDGGHELALLHEHPVDTTLERIDPAPGALPAWCAAELSPDALLASIAAWDPAIVYSQGLDEVELEATLLQRYPTLLYAHNYYGTCVSGRKCHRVPRPESCERLFGRSCVLLYYPRRCGGLHPGNMLRMFRRQSLVHSHLPQYKAILVASNHMRQEYQRNGVSPDKLHLVPLPAGGKDSLSTAPAWKTPQGRLLFVGRLTDVKGVDYLIKAIPRAQKKLGRQLTLTIAGDGPNLTNLQKLATAYNVEARFVSWVQSPQKEELMRQSDLLVVPSLWPEPFGMVGTEAGSLGLPAVGYAVGGIPDWLVPGQTGELASGNPPTVDGLVDAIVHALVDLDYYNKLCVGAWQASRRFTLQGHLEKLESILGAVLAPAVG